VVLQEIVEKKPNWGPWAEELGSIQAENQGKKLMIITNLENILERE